MSNRGLSISLTTLVAFPVELFQGLFFSENKGSPFLVGGCSPSPRGWGIPSTIYTGGNPLLYNGIEMVWLSVLERKFYSVKYDFQVDKIKKLTELRDKETGRPVYEQMLVGFAPFGGLAIWLYGMKKSVPLAWLCAEETHVDMKDFRPLTPSVSLDEICDSYFYGNRKQNSDESLNMPMSNDLYNGFMQQFTYRYEVQFGHWDDDKKEWKGYEEDEIKPKFDYIEEALFDGTHDKLHDGGLMKYHEAGKPKKLALQWHIKKSDYSAYLWFDDIAIRSAFEQFYYKYSEAKMDFTFHIDTAKKVFQLSLNCDEAEEPMPLSEDSYQMIIFKSKFEYYRTANYNQPRGAWIW